MDTRLSAAAGLVIAAMFWAIAGVSWKSFLTLGFSFLAIFLISRVFKFFAVLFISYFRVERHEPVRNPRELTLIFLNAAFSVGTPFFYYLAILYTKVSNAYFLQYTMPAWVLLVAVLFLGEKATPKKAVSFLLTIIGIFLIAKPDSILSVNPGVPFGILSALCYTGDIVTSRALREYSYHTVAVYTNAMQLLITILLAPFFFGPIDFSRSQLGLATLVAIGVLLGIASDLYYRALHDIEASKAAIICLLELLFAAFLAFILFSEAPDAYELAGYAIILAASAVIILREPPRIPHFERLLHFTDKQ